MHEDEIASQSDAWRPGKVVGMWTCFCKKKCYVMQPSYQQVSIVSEVDEMIYRIMGKNTHKQGS